MPASNRLQGMGWLPDWPDVRDYTPEHEDVAPLVAATGATKSHAVPDSVDLEQWCSPIEDQGQLGSCTAHAAVGLVEYFERKAFGRHIDASRLFVYKATRNLLRSSGDTGAFLRSAMGALVLFGAPPEDYWPYDTEKFDDEPPSFCYAFGQSFQAIKYLRLDPPGTKPERILEQVKSFLASQLPVMFGFTVYSSIRQADQDGKIPLPAGREKVEGGHAIIAIGYDDALRIDHRQSSGTTQGAVKIRNSWGTGWGDRGYGWLPYNYVTEGLAEDWWTLITGEWVETGAFAG
jgi:C1A family cysteine protease